MKQESGLEADTIKATYKITIYGFDSGLNEVLNGVHYDFRQKRIVNPVKKSNDDTCIKAIRFSKELREVESISTPIRLHYKIFAKDKRRDRMNIASAVDKSFEDALQKTGKIKNDGWNDVLGASFEFEVDKEKPRVEVTIYEVRV